MKSTRDYRLLFRIVIVGLVLSFGRFIVMAFYTIAIGMGGHGEEAVIESEKDGNEAKLFFFLTIALIATAIVLRRITSKARIKNSE